MNSSLDRRFWARHLHTTTHHHESHCQVASSSGAGTPVTTARVNLQPGARKGVVASLAYLSWPNLSTSSSSTSSSTRRSEAIHICALLSRTRTDNAQAHAHPHEQHRVSGVHPIASPHYCWRLAKRIDALCRTASSSRTSLGSKSGRVGREGRTGTAERGRTRSPHPRAGADGPCVDGDLFLRATPHTPPHTPTPGRGNTHSAELAHLGQSQRTFEHDVTEHNQDRIALST